MRPTILRDPEIEDTRHPVGRAIDELIHRVRDTKVAAKLHVPLAWDVAKQTSERIVADLRRLGPLIGSSDSTIAVVAQKEVSAVIQRLERLQQSDVAGTMERGLFLTLFTAFDAFTGDMMRALFARKPGLFAGLDRSVQLSEILNAGSIQQVHENVLELEIETLRRKSYSEQFADLENRYGLKLRAFTRWPDFVECAQRRNLLTHCDGKVSTQYLKACREAGLAAASLPAEGDFLALGGQYFQDSCELVIEVGFKLGQTLWRKMLPEELDQAEKHLSDTLFSALKDGSWRRGRMMGEFGAEQKKWSSERHRRTVVVNLAQALKRDGDAAKSRQILDEVDWSASSAEFQLAADVLRERYADAAEKMRQIGKTHSLLQEQAYHIWPLFIEFRETEHFANAYKDVFGHSYSAKLGEEVAVAQKEAAQEVAEAAQLTTGLATDREPESKPLERPPEDEVSRADA